ncbi:hypothetical protein RAA17_02205 [Komagataeibacter rhaeticus]|nr:hypothetical protein [Komagataeibacter rhaeticus]
MLIGRVFAFASQDVELYYRQEQLHGRVGVILVPPIPNTDISRFTSARTPMTAPCWNRPWPRWNRMGGSRPSRRNGPLPPIRPARCPSPPLFRWGVFLPP